MQNPQKARLDMFRRANQLLASEEQPPDLAAPVAELEGVILRLEEFQAEQERTKRNGRELTADVRRLAQRLRSDHIRPIALAARTALHVAPADRDALLPKLRNITVNDYTGLIGAAMGLAKAVEPHAESLVAAGLPKDFIARLMAAVDSLKEALAARHTERQRRTGITEGLRREVVRGYDVLRLLSSLVIPRLRNDPVRLAEWKSATRVLKIGLVPRPSGESDAPAPDETPSTPTAEPSSEGGTIHKAA